MFENILLEKFLRQAVSSIDGSVMKDDEFYFKCPICGDSKRNKSIKRGHLKLYNSGAESFWYYKCFNGDCIANHKSISAENFLKSQFQPMHKMYVRELIKNKNSSNHDEIKELNRVLQKQNEESQKKRLQKNLVEEKESLKHFVPITGDHWLCKKARAECERRKIPPQRSQRFFVATGGKYKNRLVIPFYNAQNEIYYYQCRALYENDAKYINRKSNKDESVYNIYNIERDKPVCVLEGPFDSMFIENSIATMGVEVSPKMKEQLNVLDCYYIMDNDEAGSNTAKKELMVGNFVFLWKKFIKDYNLPTNIKDVNDVYIYLNKKELFKWTDLEKYFTNNFYDGALL